MRRLNSLGRQRSLRAGLWGTTSFTPPPAAVASYLVREDGSSRFLLEDGTSKLIMEA